MFDTPDKTVHALRVLMATVVLLPVLLFAVATYVDHSAVLRRAEADGRKTVALLHEQAANLFGGHDIILDSIIERVRGLSWEQIASSRESGCGPRGTDNRLDESRTSCSPMPISGCGRPCASSDSSAATLLE